MVPPIPALVAASPSRRLASLAAIMGLALSGASSRARNSSTACATSLLADVLRSKAMILTVAHVFGSKLIVCAIR